MRIKQLRRVIKGVFTGQLVEETGWRANWHVAASSNHLTVAGGNFPIFVFMIPQESGIRVGGSFNENWPRRPRHLYKISHWRELRLLILEKWSFKVNEFTQEKFNGGDYWSEFEGLTAEIELVATSRLKFILLWVDFNYWGSWTSQVTKVLKLYSPPSSLPRRPGTSLGVLRKRCLSALQEFGWEE